MQSYYNIHLNVFLGCAIYKNANVVTDTRFSKAIFLFHMYCIVAMNNRPMKQMHHLIFKITHLLKRL